MNINLLYICHIGYIFDLSYIIFVMKIDNKLYLKKCFTHYVLQKSSVITELFTGHFSWIRPRDTLTRPEPRLPTKSQTRTDPPPPPSYVLCFMSSTIKLPTCSNI